MYKRLAQFEAIIATYHGATKAATAMAGVPPQPFVSIAAAGAYIANGLARVTAIENQKFALGGVVGDVNRSRQPDNVMVGGGEFVMPAQQTAQNIDLLRDIRNNTANTSRGGDVHNYYGLSTEQVIEVQRNNERRNRRGTLI
jgi:hypothetical protein